jgi:antitoxin HicB
MEYAAKITQDGDWWEVSFPDRPDIHTCGESFDHAREMAQEALNGMLEGELEMGRALTTPKTSPNAKRHLYAVPVEPEIEIAYLIRDARQGKTEAQAAKAVGISCEAWHRFETPLGNPTWGMLRHIADSLGRRLELRLV